MVDNKVQVAIIGCGSRSESYFFYFCNHRKDVDIIAVCDLYEDRAKNWADFVEEKKGVRPAEFTDYREALRTPGLDACFVVTSWRDHIPVAIEAMKQGVRPGVEVAAAYSLDQLWQLVHTYEETGVPCMLLENCCYGQDEMRLLNMVKAGLFGTLVHVSGGYNHDLRGEITEGRENRHYRLRQYMYRNTENYPTHELGPLAQMLDINHGNRMMTLTSTATDSFGLNAYLQEEGAKNADMKEYPFRQGDVVTTTIKCARGETITLTLNTSLPQAYSRDLRIQGTKATYIEANRSLFVEGVNSDQEPYWRKQWGNFDDFKDEYEHPIWKNITKEQLDAGHGGMDPLVFSAFIDSVREGVNPPIDVYDMAAWMSIGPLAEQSIAMGGMPQAIPDFTNGHWTDTDNYNYKKY